MKKLLLSFILIFSIFLSGCLKSDDAQSGESLKIAARADKPVYSSYEKIIINVELTGSQDLKDVLITAKGIKAYSGDFFNESRKIDLEKNQSQEIQFIKILPSCNSCSGLRPGDYAIAVSALHQGEILVEQNVNIRIKQ